MDGIGALVRRGQRICWLSFYHVRTRPKMAFVNQEEGVHQIPAVQAPRSQTAQSCEKSMFVDSATQF